jgi:hypothetical protein
VLAFRRRVMHLVERLPAGSLTIAAAGGLQDSAPRAAVTSLAARTTGVEPDDWEHPDLVQIWGQRGAVYVVPVADVAVFTLGRLPRDRHQQEALHALATKAGVSNNELRWASPTGRVRIRWDTRTTESWLVDPPAADPEDCRLELARRFLGWLGPSTVDGFAWWAGIEPDDAAETWKAISGELVVVNDDHWMLAADEEALRPPAGGGDDGPEPVRWLPQGDPYLGAADRRRLIPDHELCNDLFPNGVWPGALLVDGEIVGTWRRSQGRITATPWWPLDDASRDAAVQEAAAMPVPATIRVEWRPPLR